MNAKVLMLGGLFLVALGLLPVGGDISAIHSVGVGLLWIAAAVRP